MAIVRKYSLNWNLTDLTWNWSWTLTWWWYTSGGINWDLSLSWSWQYATCSNINSYIAWNNKLTIEALVYPTSTAYKMISVNRQQSWSYYIDFQLAKDSAGKIDFATYWQNNSWWAAVLSIATIPQNKYSYVTWVYDWAKIKVYVNWVFSNEVTQTVNFWTTSWANLMLWRNTPVSSTQDWAWKLDEVVYRNNALSNWEIKTRYSFLKWFI